MLKNLKAFDGHAQYSWPMLDKGGHGCAVHSLQFGVRSSGFMTFLLEATTVLAGLDRPPVL